MWQVDLNRDAAAGVVPQAAPAASVTVDEGEVRVRGEKAADVEVLEVTALPRVRPSARREVLLHEELRVV